VDRIRFFKLLKIEETDDIQIIYRAARRLAYKIHPDANSTSTKQWGEFEPFWDAIRNQRKDRNRTFVFPNIESDTNFASNAQGKREGSRPREPKSTKRGQDIHVMTKIKFDQIVSGCQKRIRIPEESSKFIPGQGIQYLLYEVTPTPLWLTQSGSVDDRARNAVFNKKVVIEGAGRAGINGGKSGNLKISFNVDVTGARAGQDLIEEYFNKKLQFKLQSLQEQYLNRLQEQQLKQWQNYNNLSYADLLAMYLRENEVNSNSNQSAPQEYETRIRWGRVGFICGAVFLIIRLIQLKSNG